jgi:hypothetical protein
MISIRRSFVSSEDLEPQSEFPRLNGLAPANWIYWIQEGVMAESSKSATARRWVEGWKRAGSRMRELNRAELQNISTEQALQNLAGAFESCRLHFAPRPTSGLVEQQRWFRKLKK